MLGLLIAEDFGIDFTTEDVGKAWAKYLSHACTAERIALENLQKGISAMDAADINNPLTVWIVDVLNRFTALAKKVYEKA